MYENTCKLTVKIGCNCLSIIKTFFLFLIRKKAGLLLHTFLCPYSKAQSVPKELISKLKKRANISVI